MCLRYILGATSLVLLFACNKKHDLQVVIPPPPAVFLKNITIPNLPSPYYAFDYDAAGKMAHASHASGDRLYEILYNGNKISELRNNNGFNMDTLRYFYDVTGRVSVIRYIDKNNVTYKRCFLTYTGDRLQKAEWELIQGGGGFIIDRTSTFTYLADGNLSQMTDYLPSVNGSPEVNRTTKFEQYDDKINTDDFILVHEGGNPHMLILPGVKLQKNNPRKVTRTGTGLNYIIDYTYTYNEKGAVLSKIGDMLFTSGQNQGQRFQTSAFQTYYN